MKNVNKRVFYQEIKNVYKRLLQLWGNVRPRLWQHQTCSHRFTYSSSRGADTVRRAPGRCYGQVLVGYGLAPAVSIKNAVPLFRGVSCMHAAMLEKIRSRGHLSRHQCRADISMERRTSNKSNCNTGKTAMRLAVQVGELTRPDLIRYRPMWWLWEFRPSWLTDVVHKQMK